MLSLLTRNLHLLFSLFFSLFPPQSFCCNVHHPLFLLFILYLFIAFYRIFRFLYAVYMLAICFYHILHTHTPFSFPLLSSIYFPLLTPPPPPFSLSLSFSLSSSLSFWHVLGGSNSGSSETSLPNLACSLLLVDQLIDL